MAFYHIIVALKIKGGEMTEDHGSRVARDVSNHLAQWPHLIGEETEAHRG